ncbi:MAG TPA: histidine kinase [Nocardioides sp.]|nr:histidine kinase [Nocardioides sp.]
MKGLWAARVGAWLLTPALLTLSLTLERRISDSGRDYAGELTPIETAAFLVPLLLVWAIGVVITWRVPRNLVGWLFLGIPIGLSLSGVADAYGYLGTRIDSSSWPLAGVVATYGDASFAWIFMFLALCLQLTPTGRLVSPRWRGLAVATVLSTCLFQIGSLLRTEPLAGANKGLVSPWAVETLERPIGSATTVSVVALGCCLILSVASVVVRFRRSRGQERQQLLWLIAGVIPLPVCIAGAYAASFEGSDGTALLFVGLGISLLGLGTAFAVVKYRLYGVERVVSEAAAYLIASSALVSVFGLVVLTLTTTVPGVDAGSVPTTVLATLAAAAVALPAYRSGRDVVDRRFNRRRFDALRLVTAGLDEGTPDLPRLLRDATGDPTLTVAFSDQENGWVTLDGRPAAPRGIAVDVERGGGKVARINFDPTRVDREVVQAMAQVASAEVDNLRLRAELARQLELTRQSRARLAGAHLAERRRMERDLHDGAQQRLLGIALQLQSARINGDPRLLATETATAIDQLRAAVQELRDLAHGLQPQSLASGGLRAAVEDLAARIPHRLDHAVVDARFEEDVESAAWFVIAEAVANAVKHAGVERITVEVTAQDDVLTVSVEDEGAGGADASGPGLQGLADRVAALGGTLRVTCREARGTLVEAVIPCG